MAAPSERVGIHGVIFNLLDLRHARASTAVTSNIELSAWGKYLGDASIAVAILDRFAGRAVHIDIDGPSDRAHQGPERAKAKRTKPPTTTRTSSPLARARNGSRSRRRATERDGTPTVGALTKIPPEVDHAEGGAMASSS